MFGNAVQEILGFRKLGVNTSCRAVLDVSVFRSRANKKSALRLYYLNNIDYRYHNLLDLLYIYFDSSNNYDPQVVDRKAGLFLLLWFLRCMVRQSFSVKADIKAGKTYHIHGLHLGILMTLRLNFNVKHKS